MGSEPVKDYPEDKILYYAAETTLQLYLTESGENIRNLYAVAYSSKKTTELIQSTITDKLEYVFREQLPEYEKKDFYKKRDCVWRHHARIYDHSVRHAVHDGPKC